jgi:hypothetical protein
MGLLGQKLSWRPNHQWWYTFQVWKWCELYKTNLDIPKNLPFPLRVSSFRCFASIWKRAPDLFKRSLDKIWLCTHVLVAGFSFVCYRKHKIASLRSHKWVYKWIRSSSHSMVAALQCFHWQNVGLNIINISNVSILLKIKTFSQNEMQ